MSPKRPKTDREVGPVVIVGGDNEQICSACGDVTECATIASERDQTFLAHICGMDMARALEAMTGQFYTRFYLAQEAQRKIRTKQKAVRRVVYRGTIEAS